MVFPVIPVFQVVNLSSNTAGEALACTRKIRTQKRMTTDPFTDLSADKTHANTNETRIPSVSLRIDMATKVNFASAQNDVPVLRSLSVVNETEDAFDHVRITLTAQPAVIKPKTWVIDRLPSADSIDLRDLATPLDVQRLSGLNETEIGSLTLTAENEDGRLAAQTQQLELLARDQWGGVGDMDRLLAAFVSPNDPVVATILKEASVLLERGGHDGSLEGYQSGDPQRAWMIAGAIWSAMTGMGLTYANPPPHSRSRARKSARPSASAARGLPPVWTAHFCWRPRGNKPGCIRLSCSVKVMPGRESG